MSQREYLWPINSEASTNAPNWMNRNNLRYFILRDAMRKRGTSCRPVSVSLSVPPSRLCIVYRRLKILSNFFLGPVDQSFYDPKCRYRPQLSPNF